MIVRALLAWFVLVSIVATAACAELATDSEHDAAKAEAVCICEVIDLRLTKERLKDGSHQLFESEWATVKVAKSIRGTLAVADQVVVYLGGRLLPAEGTDEYRRALEPMTLPMGAAAYPLELGRFYVLMLNKTSDQAQIEGQPGDLPQWHPRSGRQSIRAIVQPQNAENGATFVVDAKGDKSLLDDYLTSLNQAADSQLAK